MSLKYQLLEVRTLWKPISDNDDDCVCCVICHKPFQFWQRKYYYKDYCVEEKKFTILGKGHNRCLENEVKAGRMVKLEY